MDHDSLAARRVARLNRWWRRLGWLLGLWLCGVLAVGLVALGFRGLMGALGLTG